MNAKAAVGTAIEVPIVAGSVQLSKDDMIIGVHPIRHDRGRGTVTTSGSL